MQAAFRNFLLIFVFGLFPGIEIYAQVQKFQSPELETMYANGMERQKAKDFTASEAIFKQLLKLEPENFWTKAGLAYNYLSTGNYTASAELYEQIKNSGNSGDFVFQLLAESYLQSGQFKKALSTVEEGLKKFPTSGGLYFEQGKIYEAKNDLPAALQANIGGIKAAPSNDLNYRAAFVLLNANHKGTVWCPLIGEIYLSMPHEVFVEEDSIKVLVYNAWGAYFNSLGDDHLNMGQNFEGRLNKFYITLTPIMSDGLSTENLIMTHMRTILGQGSFGLNTKESKWFDWQERIVRDGFFDVYQQWLFGKAESPNQFNAWTGFHTGMIEKWNSYFAQHPFVPDADFVKLFAEDIDCKQLLGGKKKR